jgi:hypothetical protein
MTPPINISKYVSGAALAAALAFSGTAGAVSVGSLFVTGTNRMSDHSGEIALTPTYNATNDTYTFAPVTGALAAGDILVSGSNYSGAWTPNTGSPGSGGVDELTGINIIEVDTVRTVTDTSGCQGKQASLPGGCGAFTFTAAGADLFNATLAEFGITSPDLNGLSIVGSTTSILFDDPSLNFTRDSTNIDTNLQSAADGSAILVAGLIPLNGDTWTAQGPLDVSNFTLFPAGAALGNFAVDLTVTGYNIPGVMLTSNDLTGDGTVSRPPVGTVANPASAYPIFDQSSVTVFAKTVPEPATLSLLGMGLLGIGASKLRRRRPRAKS